MKKYRSCYHLSILAAGLFPFLAGCVTDQDFRSLELQFRNLDNRMVALENQVQDMHSGGSSVELMKKQQAGLSSNLDRLNAELLQVKGQLDESRHRYRNMQADNKNLQEELKKIRDLEQKTGELQERIGTMESSTSEIDTRLSTVDTHLADIKETQATAATRAAEEARKKAEAADKAEAATKSMQPHEIAPEKTKKTPAEAKRQQTVEQASPAETPQKQGESSGNKMYDEALDLFKAKKYKESQELFSEFIKKNPDHDLSVNARFWVGDCLYNQNEFALAILEYQNVIADYPNHTKAPAALFKQAMAFENLQDDDTAKIVYKKIIAEYPKSDQVAAAKKKLEELEK
ncbi:MAG: tol-pal system protein YbgF [Deltaproteobacteria bacterium]|nr:tol-pal system protein YbgF [Deltaproteobacteria bacterium]